MNSSRGCGAGEGGLGQGLVGGLVGTLSSGSVTTAKSACSVYNGGYKQS